MSPQHFEHIQDLPTEVIVCLLVGADIWAAILAVILYRGRSKAQPKDTKRFPAKKKRKRR